MKILKIGSFLLVALMAFFLSRALNERGSEKEGMSRAASSNGGGLQVGSSALAKKSDSKLHRHLKSSEFQAAWDALAEQDLGRSERLRWQKQIVTDWAEVDPEAAIQAILDEPWDNGQRGRSDVTVLLNAVVSNSIKEGSLQLWTLLDNGVFGAIGTSKVKGVWFETLAKENADLFLDFLPSLDSRDLAKALEGGVHSLSRDELLGVWEVLGSRGAEGIARNNALVLSSGNRLSSSELYALIKSEDEGVARLAVGALARKRKNSQEVSDPLEDLAAVPDALRPDLAFAFLTNGVRKMETLEASVGELVSAERWDLVSGKSIPQQIKKFGRNLSSDESADLAAWAANLPQSKEVQALYLAGLDSYLKQNPQGAWGWMMDFEPGLWRDRGFAAMSQKALHHFRDPELSRRSLDQIADPAFQAEAEKWRGNWEAKQ